LKNDVIEKELNVMSQGRMMLKGKLAFVMGGGKFGTNALRYLKAKGSKVLVSDINPDCTAKSEVTVQADGLAVADSLADGQAAFLLGDAVELLLSLLETKVPELVVTAIPGNAAAKVIESWLSKLGYRLEPYRTVIPRVLESIPKSLVSFVDESSAVIVVSYMPSNMRCRENCMPPKDFCPVTGRPKLAPMDKLLRFSVHNHTDASTILRSMQLTSGLGAIDGKELHSLLKQLENLHKPYTLAIGTACDCHGILNLIKAKK
jgi:hypothetical protein